jgi:exodeoxyribonuclease VII small subunit
MKHTTFKEAYGTLQQHAQTLRDQTEPNIDDLLTIVTESVAAYKVCQTRIDAVEKALEKALGTAHQADSNTDGIGSGPSGPSADPDEPF